MSASSSPNGQAATPVSTASSAACALPLSAARSSGFAAYTYLSLGCSKIAEEKMLAFARAQVGKPFSNTGMARSLVWPRNTDGSSWFCAELVAAILKVGGLMCANHSNPLTQSPAHPFVAALSTGRKTPTPAPRRHTRSSKCTRRRRLRRPTRLRCAPLCSSSAC